MHTHPIHPRRSPLILQPQCCHSSPSIILALVAVLVAIVLVVPVWSLPSPLLSFVPIIFLPHSCCRHLVVVPSVWSLVSTSLIGFVSPTPAPAIVLFLSRWHPLFLSSSSPCCPCCPVFIVLVVHPSSSAFAPQEVACGGSGPPCRSPACGHMVLSPPSHPTSSSLWQWWAEGQGANCCHHHKKFVSNKKKD